MYMYTTLISSLQDGISPIYAASHEDHTEVVDILLKNEADPDLGTKVWGACM